MADLYGTPPDSEEMSNILSQLLHGSSSFCMPHKATTYMHLLHSSIPPPHTTSSPEDHRMLGRSEDRRVSASSDFNFSASAGMKECGHSDANTSLKGRRSVSWENDLGDVSCDSEVCLFVCLFVLSSFWKLKTRRWKLKRKKERKRDGNFCFLIRFLYHTISLLNYNYAEIWNLWRVLVELQGSRSVGGAINPSPAT